MGDGSKFSPHGWKFDLRRLLLSDPSNRMSSLGRSSTLDTQRFNSIKNLNQSKVTLIDNHKTVPLLFTPISTKPLFLVNSAVSDTPSDLSVDYVDSPPTGLPHYPAHHRSVLEGTTQQINPTQALLMRLNYLVNVINFLKHQNLQRKLTETTKKLKHQEDTILTQQERLEALKSDLVAEKALTTRAARSLHFQQNVMVKAALKHQAMIEQQRAQLDNQSDRIQKGMK